MPARMYASILQKPDMAPIFFCLPALLYFPCLNLLRFVTNSDDKMAGYHDTVHNPHGTFTLYHSPATLRHVIAGDFSQPTSSSTLPTPPPSTNSAGIMEESPIPEASPGSSSAHERHAPGRVLACVQCQTRKLKCNRQFPCARCLKSGTTCVPATAVGKNRKKRFAERELLERLRRYEDLLRANNIAFDALHAERPAEREASVNIKEEPEEHSPFETQYVVNVRRKEEEKQIADFMTGTFGRPLTQW